MPHIPRSVDLQGFASALVLITCLGLSVSLLSESRCFDFRTTDHHNPLKCLTLHMAEHKSSRSRSKAACQFCRARKLKCDNLEPTCSACKARNIHCEYVIRAPAPRPSNAAIHALQNEVARLRRLLEQANVKVEDGIDVDAGPEDRVTESSQDQALTSPVFSDGTHSMRRQSEADQIFDPQLQSMETPSGVGQPALTQNFALDHASPRWQESRHIDPVTSSLDENTKGVLRSQLVAFSARQRRSLTLS
jgi:hypothetical protein